MITSVKHSALQLNCKIYMGNIQYKYCFIIEKVTVNHSEL